MKPDSWQVQEAKADFSALIRAANEQGPQTITRHGEAVAVVVSAQAYAELRRRKHARRGSLLEFLASWPALELPERDRTDSGRQVDL